MTRESDYYEWVTRRIFHDLREYLGIDRMSSDRTKHVGTSGAEWTVDASCYRIEDDTLVILECRRKTNSKVEQEEVGGLAYRFMDIGADMAYMVTPIGFQKGAQKVANANKINMVTLNADATDTEYILAVADQLFRGLRVSEYGVGTDSVNVYRSCDQCGQELVPIGDGQTFVCITCQS